MGIRARTALIVTVTMLVLTAVLTIAARAIILDGFATLERRDTEKSTRLALNFMDIRSEAMGATAVSYAAWTPTWTYMRTRDPGYLRTYLRDVDIDSLEIDFMAFIAADGEIVSVRMIDQATGHLIDVPAGLREYLEQPHQAFLFGDPRDRAYGFAGLPEGPVVLGAAPIVTSASEGPIRGTLVAGYFMNETDKRRLAETTGLSANWFSVASERLTRDQRDELETLGEGGGIDVRETSDDVVVGRGVKTGIDKLPAVVVDVALDRSIAQRGRDVVTYMTIGMLVFTGLSVAALIVVLNTTVLTRLAALGNAVAGIGRSETPSGRVEERGHDEITALASGINGMLEALERSRLELVEQATRDGLTGVYNRRRFEEDLARELAEAERLGRAGAVLWFDLDGFKQVNDRHGHGTGDEVLVRFAETLRGETRGYSTLARIGGDEFVMVIPGADEAEARRAAQRLLDVFAGRPVEIGDLSLRIGASIGIALYPRDGQSVERLLSRADAAMYTVKRAGGGRALVYGPAVLEDEGDGGSGGVEVSAAAPED